MIYYLIFIFIAGHSLMEIYNMDRVYKLFLLFFTLALLTFVASMRYKMGGDFIPYTSMFYKMPSLLDLYKGEGIDIPHVETLYLYLMGFVKLFTNDYTYLFGVVAFIAISLKFRFFASFSPYLFTTILLYYSRFYFVGDMGTIRQGLAMGIALLSLFFIETKRPVWFLATVTLAIGFHFSAVVYYPLYIWVKFPLTKKRILIITVLVIGISFFGWLKPMINVFPILQYGYFLGKSLPLINMVTLQQLFILFVYTSLFFDKLDEKDRLLFKVYFIGVLWRMFFREVDIIGARMSNNFTIVEVLLLSNCLKYIENRSFRDLTYWGLVAFGLMLLSTSLSYPGLDFLPFSYKFIY